MSNKVYIGIDPGKQGAISVIFDNDLIRHWSMPLIGKEYDIKTLTRIIEGFSKLQVYCVLESVHALFGSSANNTFEFGYGLGVLEGILTSHEIPYSKITPKIWQKLMFQGVPLITKPSSTGKTQKTDTKKMALIAAQRIFPKETFLQSERCKKPHEGFVDACLMAEYARRNF
jgi:hypothetical protein